MKHEYSCYIKKMTMLPIGHSILLWGGYAAHLVDNALIEIEVLHKKFRSIVASDHFNFCFELIFSEVDKLNHDVPFDLFFSK